MVVKPAFSADHLCDDFIATLKSNGLITKDEISKHGDDLRVTIQLYAIAAMHNCVVQIGDGTTTQLKAAPVGKSISVSARVPNLYSAYNAPVTYIAAAMFTAELDPDVHCHPDLRVTGTPPHAKNQEWNFEIELAPNKLLSRLG
jgi:hypothetical protein